MKDTKFEETKMLIESSFQSANSFDKAILTLTSGAFGLSLLFLKEIGPISDKNSLYLLKWGWSLFALSLVVILASFLTSQKACNFEIKRIYLDLFGKTNKWSVVTQLLNYVSIITLILAIFFMGNFFYKNLSNNQRGYMSDKKELLKEGYVPPVIQKGSGPTTTQKGSDSVTIITSTQRGSESVTTITTTITQKGYVPVTPPQSQESTKKPQPPPPKTKK